MPSEPRPEESTRLPANRLLVIAAVGWVLVLVSLALLYGFYQLAANGPARPVRPAPLSNASAPVLETQLFREKGAAPPPDAALARAQGYRWSDPAHTRVDLPIERAMAMVAARGANGFDPPAGEAKP